MRADNFHIAVNFSYVSEIHFAFFFPFYKPVIAFGYTVCQAENFCKLKGFISGGAVACVDFRTAGSASVDGALGGTSFTVNSQLAVAKGAVFSCRVRINHSAQNDLLYAPERFYARYADKR